VISIVLVKQQIQLFFISQRTLDEVGERPSKAYLWKAFLMANIVVEVLWQVLTAIVTYACYVTSIPDPQTIFHVIGPKERSNSSSIYIGEQPEKTSGWS
jgi:hypothetical protein